jgi:hypothetical protein
MFTGAFFKRLKNEIIMTQEEFYELPLLDQILYDETGMLVDNHPSIAEAMEKYHQAKLKLLSIADVSGLACKCGNMIFTHRHSNWIMCTVCHNIEILQA